MIKSFNFRVIFALSVYLCTIIGSAPTFANLDNDKPLLRFMNTMSQKDIKIKGLDAYIQSLNENKSTLAEKGLLFLRKLQKLYYDHPWHLPKHLKATGLGVKAPANDLAFKDYQRNLMLQIREARIKGGMKGRQIVPEDLIAYRNAPFEMVDKTAPKAASGKYKRGILLIHGLQRTPFEMRSLGKHFRDKGFLVRSVLLPGHGTVPGDLVGVKAEEYIKTAEWGVSNLKKDAEDIYIAGYSTGGTLATYAAETDPTIKGIFLISPALGFEKKATIAIHVTKHFRFLAKIFPKLKYRKILNELDPYNYFTLPLSAAFAVNELIKKTQNAISKHNRPYKIFYTGAMEDTTVNTEASFHYLGKKALTVFKSKSRTDIDGILYSSAYSFDLHNWLQGQKLKNEGFKLKIKYITPEDLRKGIAMYSHTSLHIPPNHEEYGKDGLFPNCRHYPQYSQKQILCRNFKPSDEEGQVLYGERFGDLKDIFILRRTTFNPQYDEMLKRMTAYMEEHGIIP